MDSNRVELELGPSWKNRIRLDLKGVYLEFDYNIVTELKLIKHYFNTY